MGYSLKYRGPINFKLERQPNGKWAIRGVPIFACHESKNPNYLAKVDEPWMRACVADQQKLKAEGFLPRLFVEHTSDNPDAPAKGIIGYLDNYRFSAAEQWLFADYVDIDEPDLDTLRRFPGRSAEPKRNQPAIHGVAVLGATPPYFKFPDVKFADGESVCRYSIEIENTSKESSMAIDPKAAESNASSTTSPEDKADYAKFCRYMKAYEEEKAKTQTPAEPDKYSAQPGQMDGVSRDSKEWKGAAARLRGSGEGGKQFSDPELTAKYAEIVETNRSMAAKIVALEEAGEKATWTAKYAEARIPANRIDVAAKVDLLMKLPKDVRRAFYDDSLRGIVAPSTRPLDPKDTAGHAKPEPGSQEEADAVKAFYHEQKGKGRVKNYAEAQALYLKEVR